MKFEYKNFLKIFFLYTLLFFLIINIKIHSIFVYQGILSMLITSIILIIFLPKDKYPLKILIVLFSMMIHFSIFLFVPVTIDRSISVNLLVSLNEKYSEDSFGIETNKEEITMYTTSDEFVMKRVDEQISSNNIKKVNDKYILTSLGRFIVDLFEVVSKLYRIN